MSVAPVANLFPSTAIIGNLYSINMRNFLLGILTTVAIVVILGFVPKKGSIIPKKEWVVAPRFLTLQKGITKEQAREWMENEYLPLYRHYSGWNAELGEPTG